MDKSFSVYHTGVIFFSQEGTGRPSYDGETIGGPREVKILLDLLHDNLRKSARSLFSSLRAEGEAISSLTSRWRPFLSKKNCGIATSLKMLLAMTTKIKNL
jgi:hypothetical protein